MESELSLLKQTEANESKQRDEQEKNVNTTSQQFEMKVIIIYPFNKYNKQFLVHYLQKNSASQNQGSDEGSLKITPSSSSKEMPFINKKVRVVQTIMYSKEGYSNSSHQINVPLTVLSDLFDLINLDTLILTN